MMSVFGLFLKNQAKNAQVAYQPYFFRFVLENLLAQDPYWGLEDFLCVYRFGSASGRWLGNYLFLAAFTCNIRICPL